MIRGPIQRILHVLGVGFGSGLNWLIRDEFTSADASPVSTPRAAEPGPGTTLFTQTDGTFGITSGNLEFTIPVSPAYDELRFMSADSFDRVAGRSLVTEIQIDSGSGAYLYLSDGVSDYATLDDVHDGLSFYFEESGEIHVVLSGGFSLADTVGSWSTGVPYKIAITQLEEGALYQIKGGAYTDWTTLFYYPDGIASNSYPAFTNFEAAGHLKYFRFWDAGASNFLPSFSVTPGQFLQDLGATELVDGGMELWSSPTNLSQWTETLNGTSTVNQESSDIDAGVYAARLDIDGSGSLASLHQPLPAGSVSDSFEVLGYSKSEPTGAVVEFLTNAETTPHTLVDTYSPYTDILRAGNPSPTFYMRTAEANASVFLDNFSVRRITPNTLQSTSSDALIDFEFILPDTPVGLMLMQSMDENFFAFLYRLVLGLLKTIYKG